MYKKNILLMINRGGGKGGGRGGCRPPKIAGRLTSFKPYYNFNSASIECAANGSRVIHAYPTAVLLV